MSRRALVLLFGLAAACSGSRTERAAVTRQGAVDPARPWKQPGDVIDSILPMAEYLRRFRGDLPVPAGLQGGATSRTKLTLRFLTALASRDGETLGALLVSRAEFGWLVFPEHLYARPPYELDPALFWLQLQSGSARGLTRTLARYGGRALRLLELRCQRDTLQLPAGPVRLWSPCELRVQDAATVVTRHLFGSMVEREGRFKFLSYAGAE